MKRSITPTSVEHKMALDSIIVSKTDLKGRITYANRTFMTLSEYSIEDLINIQHNIIRHPDMPRAVFKLLWSTLKQGNEFFGFVKNMCANGDCYWVFANVTIDYDLNGKPRGYYSVRRQPSDKSVAIISNIYEEMLAIEKKAGTQSGMDKSLAYLNEFLAGNGISYNDYILDLYNNN